MYYTDAINKMLNRKISSVILAPNKATITFAFQDGHAQSFAVEGDCCSHSWIEHLETPNDLIGAELTGFDENSMDATSDENENPMIESSYEDHEGKIIKTSSNEYECLQVYTTIFHTNKGDIVLEYRNSSNGYYGGSLVAI